MGVISGAKWVEVEGSESRESAMSNDYSFFRLSLAPSDELFWHLRRFRSEPSELFRESSVLEFPAIFAAPRRQRSEIDQVKD